MLIYYFLIVFPVTALLSLILYLPFRLRFRGRGIWYHLPRYALIGCILSLLYLTVLWYYPDISFHPQRYFLNLRPFIWVTEVYDMGPRRMLQQLVLNIGMFIPYGLLLPIVFPRLRRLAGTASVVLLTTVSIETVQYFIGRSADIDDVIMNFIGGILGWLLFTFLNKLWRLVPRWNRMLGK